jgi:DNA-binding SARP family transcriptional activator
MSEQGFVIRLLGAAQVELGGMSVRGFESHKALAFVFYLAALGQPVPRSRLAHLFWGDLDEERSRANLSRVLHNNLRLLPGCLRSTRSDIWLDPGPSTQVDTATFARLAAAGDPASLAAAAALYRGDFMEGAYLDGCPDFETWVAGQQEAWRQRMAALLGRLIAAHTEAGAHEVALAYAQRLLDLDNWREEAHRHVMLLLALTGQRTAALAQYDACRQVLARELAVEPSAQTRDLYERIRANQARPQRAPGAPAGGVAGGELEKKLAQIAMRLDHPACRLLVLAGANGTAPSLIAAKAAARRSRALRDGACDVALDPLAGDLFAATLAAALGVPEDRAGEIRRRIFAHLEEKELLLTIHNMPQHREALQLLEDILKRAPGVQILVTAPQPLDAAGEWIVELEG